MSDIIKLGDFLKEVGYKGPAFNFDTGLEEENLNEEKLNENIPPDLVKAYQNSKVARGDFYSSHAHKGLGGGNRKLVDLEYSKATYTEISKDEAKVIVKNRSDKVSQLRILISGGCVEFRPEERGPLHQYLYVERVKEPYKYTNNNGTDVYDTRKMTPYHIIKVADKIYLTDEYDHPISAETQARRKNSTSLNTDTMFINNDSIADSGDHRFSSIRNIISAKKLIKTIQNRINNTNRSLEELKQDKEEGLIDEETFKSLSRDLKSRLKDREERLEELSSEIKGYKNEFKNTLKEFTKKVEKKVVTNANKIAEFKNYKQTLRNETNNYLQLINNRSGSTDAEDAPYSAELNRIKSRFNDYSQSIKNYEKQLAEIEKSKAQILANIEKLNQESAIASDWAVIEAAKYENKIKAAVQRATDVETHLNQLRSELGLDRLKEIKAKIKAELAGKEYKPKAKGNNGDNPLPDTIKFGDRPAEDLSDENKERIKNFVERKITELNNDVTKITSRLNVKDYLNHLGFLADDSIDIKLTRLVKGEIGEQSERLSPNVLTNLKAAREYFKTVATDKVEAYMEANDAEEKARREREEREAAEARRRAEAEVAAARVSNNTQPDFNPDDQCVAWSYQANEHTKYYYSEQGGENEFPYWDTDINRATVFPDKATAEQTLRDGWTAISAGANIRQFNSAIHFENYNTNESLMEDYEEEIPYIMDWISIDESGNIESGTESGIMKVESGDFITGLNIESGESGIDSLLEALESGESGMESGESGMESGESGLNESVYVEINVTKTPDTKNIDTHSLNQAILDAVHESGIQDVSAITFVKEEESGNGPFGFPADLSNIESGITESGDLIETLTPDEYKKYEGKTYNMQKILGVYRRTKYEIPQLFAHTKCTKCGREKRVLLSNLVSDPDKYGSCKCSRVNAKERYKKIIDIYNGKKRLPNNTSGYTGVTRIKNFNGRPYNKWRASIEIDGKRYFLGDFDLKKDAVCAREQAAKKGVQWYKENRPYFKEK